MVGLRIRILNMNVVLLMRLVSLVTLVRVCRRCGMWIGLRRSILVLFLGVGNVIGVMWMGRSRLWRIIILNMVDGLVVLRGRLVT